MHREQFQDASWCTGHQIGLACDELGNIEWVEAVDIFQWGNALDGRRLMLGRGEWELDENTMNAGVVVKLLDAPQQSLLIGIAGEKAGHRTYAHLLAGTLLVPHVDC